MSDTLSNTAATTVVHQTSVLHLPPNILLTIFGYLDMKSLCLSSRVCRMWYDYANDRSLWKILDLSPYKSNLRTIRKIINRRISKYCRELHIKGYLTQTKKLEILSTPLLEEIKIKALHLSTLTLSYCYLNNIDIASFPGSINKLCLSHSLVRLGLFKTLKTKNVFPVIEDLDLTCCTRISTADITSICHLHTLKILTLNGCYRITDNDVREIATKLKNIIFLDLSDCKRITDVSLQHIAQHMKDIEKLHLCNCHLISPSGLIYLKHGCSNLEFLDLIGCSELTCIEALELFANCSKITLKTFDLDGI